MAEYVVQSARYSEAPDAERDVLPIEDWRDIATVTVPARSKRATIIAEALKQSGLMPSADVPLRLRVLDARSAVVTEVGLKTREPEWELL